MLLFGVAAAATRLLAALLSLLPFNLLLMLLLGGSRCCKKLACCCLLHELRLFCGCQGSHCWLCHPGSVKQHIQLQFLPEPLQAWSWVLKLQHNMVVNVADNVYC